MMTGVNRTWTMSNYIVLAQPDPDAPTTLSQAAAALEESLPASVKSALPILNILTMSLGVLLNVTVLILFLTHRFLRRKPFTVYLVNLLGCSLIFLLTYGPLSLLNLRNALHGAWCSLFIYTLNAPPGCIIYAHTLIVANRLWALLRPISYRHFLHSRQVATGLCVAAWTLVNVLTVPGVVLDGIYYQTTSEAGAPWTTSEAPAWTISEAVFPTSEAMPKRTSEAPRWTTSEAAPWTGICLLNVDRQLAWAVFGEIVVGVLPLVFMIGANFFLVCRGKRRLQSRTKRALSISWPETGAAASSEAPSSVACRMSSREPERALVLLVSLTLCLVVCWVPGVCFMVVNSFTQRKHPHSGARGISDLLFLLQTVADPVVLVLATPELRKVIGRMVKRVWQRRPPVPAVPLQIKA